MVGPSKAIRSFIVMPEGNGEKRKEDNPAYGPELVFTEGAESDVDIVLQSAGKSGTKTRASCGKSANSPTKINVTAH